MAEPSEAEETRIRRMTSAPVVLCVLALVIAFSGINPLRILHALADTQQHVRHD